MTIHYPGPVVMELEYTVDGLKHLLAFNVEPVATPDIGDGFDTIDLKTKNLSTIGADVWAGLFEAGMDGTFNDVDVTFDIWNLYTVAPMSYDRTYISSEATQTPTFTAPATVIAHHTIYTFRTLGGNLGKIYAMEGNQGQNDIVPYVSLLPQELIFVDVLLVTNTPMIGRDGEFFANLISRASSQNEKTYRERYR